MSAFDEKLNKISKPTVEEKLKNVAKVQENVSKKVSKWAVWLPNAVMVVFSLLIVGLSELATANFDIGVFLKAEFWSSYLTFQLAMWLLVFNILSIGFRLLTKTHKRYEKLSKQKNLIVTVDNHKPFILKHALENDRVRKIKAWKIYQNQKLNKLIINNEIADLKDFLFGVEEVVVEKENEAQNGKEVVLKEYSKVYKGRKQRLKRKIEKILTVLTDQWIEENIDGVKKSRLFWKFQYAPITRDKLISGGRIVNSNFGESDFEKHKGQMLFDLFFSGALFISVVMFLILSFRFDPKAATIETYIKIVMKLMLLTWNAVMAWVKIEEAFARTELKVIDETTNELNKYFVKEFTEEERKEFEIIFDN